MSLARVTEKWAGYKTMVINGLMLLTMIGSQFIDAPGELPSPEQVTGVIDAGIAWAVGAVNVLNMILRALTKTPVFTPTS